MTVEDWSLGTYRSKHIYLCLFIVNDCTASTDEVDVDFGIQTASI